MTFIELAEKILRDNNREMTVDEMWTYAKEKGLQDKLGSSGLTPWATLSALLGDQIRHKKDTIFGRTDTRPARYFLLSQKPKLAAADETTEPKTSKVNESKFSFLEKDLHPFLAYYANLFLKTYTKTINHNKSGKKDFGEWTHPDMVGCSFAFEELKPEVAELSASIGSLNITLYSFEIKREVTFANLRESFFQTVSNSSWANESYLVAANYSKDEDFRNELRRLSSSFGIGIIELNINDPDQSEIIFPARNRETLDWETINKLASMNTDFKEFLKRIKNDISSKEVIREKYDKVHDKTELLKIIQLQPL